MFTPDVFNAVRKYVGKFQTLRDQVRTERFMNSLPESLLKDIGWPDRYAARRAHRG
ncbi:hypothetical protein [Mesorhizobium sp. KR2-14]|uniref:hypothetical protein n=1 Tax=Mesorhizobium sp. KR2-14 TaxID=3156610 RepID=UPI0032B326F1